MTFAAQVRRKLVVVNGDLGLPGLGLAPADRNALTRDVQFIVHSAASISFVDHIHRLIAHNYIVRTLPACATHIACCQYIQLALGSWNSMCNFP